MDSQIITFPFPLKGFDQNWARSEQPMQTSPDCLNVMAYDLSERARGGVRPGVIKASTNTLGSGTQIFQAIRTDIAEDPATHASHLYFTVACGGVMYQGVDNYNTLTAYTSPPVTFNPAIGIPCVGIDGKLYLNDASDAGANIYQADLATHAFEPYTVTAGVAPLGGQIRCVWRKRLCIASVPSQPQNFFMSRQDDPHDWDYSATDPAAAVAGNLSKAGQVGETIEAMVPINDDYMIVGCANSIWRITGDPHDGGSIDLLTRGVGMTGEGGVCFDPDGNMYFFGSGGFYRLMRNNWYVENLTANRVNSYFDSMAAFDPGFPIGEQRQCVYDLERHGIWLFIVGAASGAGGNAPGSKGLFYDIRTDGFFPFQMPDRIGPVGLLMWDNDIARTPDLSYNHQLLLCGRDGILYTFSRTALSDDGQAVNSYVVIGPVRPANVAIQGKLNGIDFVLGDNPAGITDASWRVTARIQTGESPYEALSAPRQQAAWLFTSSRRQPTQAVRMAGVNFFLILNNSTAGKFWSYEEVAGRFDQAGRYR